MVALISHASKKIFT